MSARAGVAALLLAAVGAYVWRQRAPAALAAAPSIVPTHEQTAAIISGFEFSTVAGSANMRPTRTSTAGIEIIKGHEQWRDRVYIDAGGYPTIGWGHKLVAGESFPRPISMDEGLKILRADLAIAERAVYGGVRVPISQQQFDALVSFAFNVGAGAFAGSTLLRKLNAGDYIGASEEFKRWNMSGGRVQGGLVRRREDEKNLFLAGLQGVISA